jgi:arginine/lysine/histidine transporter system substrate-binding protein
MRNIFLLIPLVLLFPSLHPLQAQKVLTVATRNFKPFEFKDQNGKLTGYDIELGNEIARRLGATFKWKQMDLNQVLHSLDDGSCQLAMAALHATKTRRSRYAFSRNYIQTGLVAVIRMSEKKINSINDLNGLTVGVREEGSGDEFADEDGSKIGFRYRKYPNFEQCLAALGKGEVDAVFSDYLSSRIYLKENNDYRIPFPPFAPCGIGIAALENRSALISEINLILEDLEKEGFFIKLYNKWLLWSDR